MPLPPPLEFTLLLATLLAATLYGLAASGHFPSEARVATMRGPVGALILWSTMAIVVLALAAAIALGWSRIPWYAGVIGAGAVVLFAPLLLQAMPDSFVDGRRGLVVLALVAASAALALAQVTA